MWRVGRGKQVVVVVVKRDAALVETVHDSCLRPPTMLCRFIVHTSQTAAEGQHDIAFLLGDAAFAELHAATSTMCSDRQRQVCATCSSVARTQLRLHSKHTAAPGVPSTVTEVAVEVRHCRSIGAQQSGDTVPPFRLHPRLGWPHYRQRTARRASWHYDHSCASGLCAELALPLDSGLRPPLPWKLWLSLS